MVIGGIIPKKNILLKFGQKNPYFIPVLPLPMPDIYGTIYLPKVMAIFCFDLPLCRLKEYKGDILPTA